MLIGDPGEFAIECLNLKKVNNYCYGSLFIWINEHRIGTGDDILLTVVTDCFVDILLNSKRRQDPRLQNGDAKETLNIVWNQFYGDKDFDHQQSSFYAPYLWIHGLPGFELVRSIIIDVPTGYRIVWQVDDLAEIQEYIIKTDVCRNIISAFLGWFEKETGFVHRCYSIITSDHPALKAGRRAEAARNRKAKYEQRERDRKRELKKLAVQKSAND